MAMSARRDVGGPVIPISLTEVPVSSRPRRPGRVGHHGGAVVPDGQGCGVHAECSSRTSHWMGENSILYGNMDNVIIKWTFMNHMGELR